MQSLSTVYSKGKNYINLSGQSSFERLSLMKLENFIDCSPNSPKGICRMSNNRLVKTKRSKQCLTKALFRHLKNTFQRYLRSVSKTLPRQVMKTFLRNLRDSYFVNLTNV